MIASFFHDMLLHIQEGRFARSLAFVTACSALASGLEVAQEHYKGSYGQRVMYSPVICCLLLAFVAMVAVFSIRFAHTFLPWVSFLLIADGFIGFGFHVRGIARKPGGFTRNVLFNIVMGPPVFAPLLLGISGMLGWIAASLAPEESTLPLSHSTLMTLRLIFVISTGVSAVLNGFEAWYSHYKTGFKSRAQYVPLIVAPLLIAASIPFLFGYSQAPFRTGLNAMSIVAILSGLIGMLFHIRGILRRPGGTQHALYNIAYGPPTFAPLLFAASGFLGLLATQIGYTP